MLGNLFEDDKFEEYDSEDEERVDAHMEQLENQVIAPLTEDKIKDLIVSRLAHGIEQNFVFQRQGKVNMDNMGGMYIPMDCRDQFYYLVRKRQWRYVIYMLDVEDDPSAVFIEKCGMPEETYEDMVAALPDDRCAWAVIDLELGEGSRTSHKIVFLTYQPDACVSGQEKRSIKFNQNFFKTRLAHKTGFNANFSEVTARNKKELDYSKILQKVS